MMKGCLLLLFVFLANVFADKINVKDAENFPLIISGNSFHVEVCRTGATTSANLIFCYEATFKDGTAIGCDSQSCGARVFFNNPQIVVGLNGKLEGTTHSCEIFEISESTFVATNTKQTSNCEWKLNKDGELMLKVVEFPSGWDMTIKDVTRGKSSQSAASLWWAYLLGVVGVGCVIGGSVFLIIWLLKRKNRAIDQHKKKTPEEVELKEVKVIADQPRQTQKVENVPKPKDEQPTKEPKAVPEKKEKVKPNKPKLVLERSKDEEAPESLETISVPSGKMAKIWDKERVIVEADRQEKLRKLKEKRKAKADKRWEDDKSWYEENSKYLKEEMTQRSDDELAKDVLHFAAYLYKTKKISKNFYNKLSSRFCFQNRHVAEEDEWKMLSVSTAEGAVICQRLIAKADRFLFDHGMRLVKSQFVPDDLQAIIKNWDIPGYVWARCLARAFPKLIKFNTQEITMQALLLFSPNIYQVDREIVLRNIKISAAELINMYGYHVDDLGFYPLPILYRIYEEFHDPKHIFPPEGPNMPIVKCPAVIIKPPEKDVRGNYTWYNLPYDRIVQPEDASEAVYEEAIKKDEEERQKAGIVGPKDGTLRELAKEAQKKKLKKKGVERTIEGSIEAAPVKKTVKQKPSTEENDPSVDNGEDQGKR